MAEYIDREAFKKSVEERYCKPCKAEKKDHNGCWCRACWVDDMLDEVECFQPSDVAPVMHGRWIVRFDGPYNRRRCYCSHCEKNNGVGGIAKNQEKPYCPNCGAKMDIKDGGGNDAAD